MFSMTEVAYVFCVIVLSVVILSIAFIPFYLIYEKGKRTLPLFYAGKARSPPVVKREGVPLEQSDVIFVGNVKSRCLLRSIERNK